MNTCEMMRTYTYCENDSWARSYVVRNVRVQGHTAGVLAPVADLLQGRIGVRSQRRKGDETGSELHDGC